MRPLLSDGWEPQVSDKRPRRFYTLTEVGRVELQAHLYRAAGEDPGFDLLLVPA